MGKILNFGKFVEVSSSKIRVINEDKSEGETRYDIRLKINEQFIDGQIFVDGQGELECWQLYDSDGRCLSETYGQDVIDKIIIKKIKNIRKNET